MGSNYDDIMSYQNPHQTSQQQWQSESTNTQHQQLPQNQGSEGPSDQQRLAFLEAQNRSLLERLQFMEGEVTNYVSCVAHLVAIHHPPETLTHVLTHTTMFATTS